MVIDVHYFRRPATTPAIFASGSTGVITRCRGVARDGVASGDSPHVTSRAMSTRATVGTVILGSVVACGGGGSGSGWPATFTTSVPGNTTLNQLSGMQFTTLCNDVSRYVDSLPYQPQCKVNGVDAASSNLTASATNAEIQSACSKEYNQCLQQVPDPGTPTCMTAPPASCTATVSHYAACLNDAIARNEALLGSAPSCSSLAISSLPAEVNTLLVTPASVSASCATFRAACPYSTFDVGDLTDPFNIRPIP